MIHFRKIYGLLGLLFFIAFTGINIFISRWDIQNRKEYNVDINRLVKEIEKNGSESGWEGRYKSILNVERVQYGTNNVESFFKGDGNDSAVRLIYGVLYRFDYKIDRADEQKYIWFFINLFVLLLFILFMLLLLFIDKKIIQPFIKISEMPYELAKGNLTAGLKEDESQYFGRFIWGLDLLREHLEENKKRQLMLLKDKKTLLLSLSHDIKTPLSIIRLYVNALTKNLYEEEKKEDILSRISKKTEEMEIYINEIVKSSNEDFLDFTVKNQDFYISELLKEIQDYYSEKLTIEKTKFIINVNHNCMVRGDFDRAVEVLQNIMENAIKYGDGREIKISTIHEQEELIVKISNTGNIVDNREMPHIFDSFFRGSNIRSQTGSGLGLYICRTLMHKMEGDITAKNENGCMTVSLYFILS